MEVLFKILILCLTSRLSCDWSDIFNSQPNFAPTLPPHTYTPPNASLASIDIRLMVVPSGQPMFSPRRCHSYSSRTIAILLLLGGIESNPGPPTSLITQRNNRLNEIRLATINARSAVHKSSLVRDVIISNQLDILVVTETWFRPDMPSAILNDAAPDNYSIIHEFRSSGRGGGIAVIHKSHISIRRIEATTTHSTYERLLFKCTVGSSRINVAAVYRPPPAPTAAFFSELSDLIDYISLLPGDLVLIGDINCPGRSVLQLDDRLTALVDDYNMTQRVKSPTYIASSHLIEDSLLDVVIHFTNPSPVRCVSVLDVGLSDHRLVTANLCIPMPKPETVTFSCRNIKRLNRHIFISKLSNASFITNPADNVNDFYEQLHNDVLTVLNELAPVRKVTKRQSPCDRPKLSPDVISLKRSRRLLERQYRHNRSESNRIMYRSACRTANEAINRSRSSATIERLESAASCPRALWRISRELLCTSVNKGLDPLCKLSANVFHTFFNDKLKTIKRDIVTSLTKLGLNPAVSSFVPDTKWVPTFSVFEPVTVTAVQSVLTKLKNKSSKFDFIPTTLLKDCAQFFAPSIAYLANLSFTQSKFPEQLKTGCVRPVLKKAGQDINDANNYRPITNLGNLSKVLEQLAMIQLRTCIVGSPNFSPNQSAYRSAHSTETALLKIVNDIRINMEKSSLTCLLSLDISAAFDALDHQVLLARAEEIFGISGPALAWLRSFLTNRQCFVSLGDSANMNSQLSTVTSGVPQGSTLGPLLFSMFVSPLGKIVDDNGGICHQYADDTQLYMRLEPGLSNINSLSKCADSVATWFLQNGLKLNPSKTDSIIFGTAQRLKNVATPKPTLECLGVPIASADSVHILGVTLDNTLTLNKHVSNTVSSCNYHIRALKHIRSSLTHDAAVAIACSLVNTRLDYCNSLLYSTSQKNIARLQRVQNNLVRAVLKLRRRDSIGHHIRALHWLRINERITYKIAVLTYIALNTGQPSYLSNCLNKHTAARILILRSNSNFMLQLPFSSIKSADSAFQFSAPKVWNSLSDHTKSAASLDIFKCRLKTELFTRSG